MDDDQNLNSKPAPPPNITLNDLAKLINDNKKEIIDKVDLIANDVKAVKEDVSNLKNKVKRQEEINGEVSDKIKALECKISNLINKPASVNECTEVDVQKKATDDHQSQRQIEIIKQGKKVIGLSPIDQTDLDAEKDLAKDQNVMIAAALTFFIEDMNIPKTTLDKMKITRAFRPSNNDDSDKLYVEFEDETSADIVRRYRLNLAPGVRIFSWYPPGLYQRYKALEEEAYRLRKVIEPYHQTDIRYESADIALYKRLDRNHRWQRVQVKGLPAIVFDPDLLVKPSGGALGRARLNSKRKRNSSNEDENSSKNIRPSSSPENNISESADQISTAEAAIDQTSTIDIGRYTEHHAYSPARIAPSKHSLITTTPLNFSKLKQPTLNFHSKRSIKEKVFQ